MGSPPQHCLRCGSRDDRFCGCWQSWPTLHPGMILICRLDGQFAHVGTVKEVASVTRPNFSSLCEGGGWV
jgi:hypothetical protein